VPRPPPSPPRLSAASTEPNPPSPERRLTDHGLQTGCWSELSTLNGSSRASSWVSIFSEPAWISCCFAASFSFCSSVMPSCSASVPLVAFFPVGEPHLRLNQLLEAFALVCRRTASIFLTFGSDFSAFSRISAILHSIRLPTGRGTNRNQSLE
jgi:hypothetical protein